MKALVTGGGGFLGSAIVRRLVEQGAAVRSLSRGRYLELERLGVETVQADLADAAAVEKACRGVDVVFHVGAKAGIWGPREEFHRANVLGTRNVLDGCVRNGVTRLVHTSSPSVIGHGGDLEGVDESLPYPPHYNAPYPETKAEAERLVLAANGPSLATVALRPHLIWGPGDNHIVPRLVAKARAGQLRRLGDRPCPVDSTYIDNAADAHLLAAERLAPGAPCAGRVYFISNGEPKPVWDLINGILAAAGAPAVHRSVPVWAARAAGGLLETVHRLLHLDGEPRMTRFLADELSTAHWFDLTAARRDLGYAPKVSIEEGLRRLKASFA